MERFGMQQAEVAMKEAGNAVAACETAGVVFEGPDTGFAWSCGWHYGPGAGARYDCKEAAAADAQRTLGIQAANVT